MILGLGGRALADGDELRIGSALGSRKELVFILENIGTVQESLPFYDYAGTNSIRRQTNLMHHLDTTCSISKFEGPFSTPIVEIKYSLDDESSSKRKWEKVWRSLDEIYQIYILCTSPIAKLYKMLAKK